MASIRDSAKALWGQWWIVTLGWYLCAVWIVLAIVHEEHKAMLGALSNGFATFLVAPFALRQSREPLQRCWRPVLFIALLAALERNLGNASLYSIGGSLKTALHGFNVVCTFFAAALLGADLRGRACLLKGKCGGNLALIPALTLVAGGGLVTALCEPKTNFGGAPVGILLQLSSSVCYALKFTTAKLLLGHGHGGSESDGPAPPSKFQIALIVNPVTSVMSLIFLPFFETTWAFPSLGSIISVMFAATGILIFELQLTELTSPLTVSVLNTLHNIVLFLCLMVFGTKKDKSSLSQIAGFAVSSIGALIYVWAKQRERQEVEIAGSALPVVGAQTMLRDVSGDALHQLAGQDGFPVATDTSTISLPPVATGTPAEARHD